MEITSFSNPKIKLLRKLRDKKHRHENGLFYVEGLRIIGDALEHDAIFDAVYYCEDLLNSHFGEHLLKICEQRNIDMYHLPANVFGSFALKDHPQGIAAVLKMETYEEPKVIPEKRQIWVGLEAIADPGNLGTIFRTLDATAGSGVFLIGNCVDVYDPAVVRGSMGSFFTQPFYHMKAETLSIWKSKNNIHVIGTSDKAIKDYQEIEYPGQMILIMGSEREGLHPEIESLCDDIVSIPMSGFMDSLNLSVATSLMLYEIYNQHRKSGKVLGGRK
ncbi:MAG: RNA methyltransferase [Anaerolineaceae bacterium]|nr:RNA methyltransferase [Anaerolineaceae bacterium]